MVRITKIKTMWQEYLRIRENYLKKSASQNEAYREYLRDHFLYEIYQLGGHLLPEEQFQQILHTDRKPAHPDGLRAYDLWQAWKYIQAQAGKHAPFTTTLVREIASKIMKHTGQETTTSIGRYDTSLGDYRLGEDYDVVYPIAEYSQIPDLLAALCRETNVQLQNNGVVPLVRTAIRYLFKFIHIKPFGAGNLETGMLSTNYLLLYHQQPLLIIYGEDRPKALNAIKTTQLNQTPEEFENFMLQEQIKYFREESE